MFADIIFVEEDLVARDSGAGVADMVTRLEAGVSMECSAIPVVSTGTCGATVHMKTTRMGEEAQSRGGCLMLMALLLQLVGKEHLASRM